MARNPFTPTFGVSPPLLVGRSELLDDFATALEDGPGAPGRVTLYTGARGTGKTVMLNEVEDLARQQGWRVISETATPGFVTLLVSEHLPGLLREVDPEGTKSALTGINVPMGLGGASWKTDESHRVVPALRTQTTAACELLSEAGAGLLLTLDEVHHHQVGELRELASVLQHLVREEREIMFAGAGLPTAVNAVLNDDVLTFLRPRHKQVSADDVNAGVVAARRRLGSLVHEPAISDLPGVARTFLLAMAHDDGPSRMRDIAARLDVDGNYASQYRLRLIATELIEPVGHGRVDFTMPYLREYLREHAALEAQRELPRGDEQDS